MIRKEFRKKSKWQVFFKVPYNEIFSSGLADENSKCFKTLGPVLVDQTLAEAKETVENRQSIMEKETERLNLKLFIDFCKSYDKVLVINVRIRVSNRYKG